MKIRVATLTVMLSLLPGTPALLERAYALAPLPGSMTGARAFYFDGDDLSLSNTGLIARHNVILLVGDIFISGDEFTYSNEKKIGIVSGNVYVVKSRVRIKASSLVFDENTDEFLMRDVEMLSDPALAKTAVQDDIYRFSDAELTFESERTKRLTELTTELQNLREEYIRLRNIVAVKRLDTEGERDRIDEITKKYAITLARRLRTQNQPNLPFQAIGEEERTRLQRRREAVRQYIAQNPALGQSLSVSKQLDGYSHVAAKLAMQRADGKLELFQSELTLCKSGICPPIWGLGARSAVVEPEQYVTMEGATVDLFSIPVFYTPWFKFPVKSKRQTGLLTPSIYASRSGDVFSQPLFITLGEHADATLTYSDFTSRGYRTEVETRFALMPESALTLSGQYINDRKYLLDYEVSKVVLEEKIRDGKAAKTLDPVEEERLRNTMSAEVKSRRWYLQGSWNLPVSTIASLKANGEFVSDNRYLGDYSRATENVDLFTPSSTARRFLSQESAIEYYGDSFGLSARMQLQRDLFAQKASDTPVRLPRMELYLFPKRYFDLFMYDNVLTWERIHRLGEGPYIDAVPATQAQLPNATETLTATSIERNKRKDPSEPFLEGERTSGSARLRFPFPANDWFNANAGLSAFGTQYTFPATVPFSKTQERLGYTSINAELAVPLYSKVSLFSAKANELKATIQHNYSPSLSLNYIPSVERTKGFPADKSLFYAADSTAVATKRKTLTFAWSSVFSVTRESFVPTPSDLPRIAPQKDIGVANENVLENVLAKSAIDLNRKTFYAYSNDIKSSLIYTEWAKSELEIYESQVLADHAGGRFIWTGPVLYRRKADLTFTPLTFNLATSYNFMADETAAEANAQKNPVDPKDESVPWSDVVLSGTASLAPFLPISGAASGSWNMKWQVWSAASGSINLALPGGLSVGTSNGYTLREVAKPGTVDEKIYYQDRIVSLDAGYQPIPWLKFQFQREMKINGDSDARPRAEWEYRNYQAIQFLGLQDCVNIIISRRKDYENFEYQATWAITFNLKFMNQERGWEMGDRLNRQVHDSWSNKARAAN